MTPLQIEMLLHFHCTPGPFPRMDAPACIEAVEGFLRDELVYPVDVSDCFVLSERGRAYVKLLCQMPLPVANWVIPGPWQPSIPGEGAGQ